jgi:hypothetical protein
VGGVRVGGVCGRGDSSTCRSGGAGDKFFLKCRGGDIGQQEKEMGVCESTYICQLTNEYRSVVPVGHAPFISHVTNEYSHIY